MTVAEISNLERIPMAIDYRRTYRGTTIIAVGDRRLPGCRIEFTLEMSPWGTHEVNVRFIDPAEYPIVPAIKILKEHIATMDRNGELP
ncbi:MAG: hypothetical protein ACOCU4_00895 [Alkalispirochaeta sp.]